jgi:lysophospholipase L1-like esterase
VLHRGDLWGGAESANHHAARPRADRGASVAGRATGLLECLARRPARPGAGSDVRGRAATVTDDVNTAIKTVAAETGSAYVDLRAAFKGPDYRYDENHYLASDGDHPNAAGHQQIAVALERVAQTEPYLPPS